LKQKKSAIEAGVILFPGYMGTISSVKQALDIAGEISFPVIVKGDCRWGGRGMRVVKNQKKWLMLFGVG